MNQLFTFNSQQIRAITNPPRICRLLPSNKPNSNQISHSRQISQENYTARPNSVGTPKTIRRVILKRKITFDQQLPPLMPNKNHQNSSLNIQKFPTRKRVVFQLGDRCNQKSTVLQTTDHSGSDQSQSVRRCISFLEKTASPTKTVLQQKDNRADQSVCLVRQSVCLVRQKRIMSLKTAPKTAVPLSNRKLPKAFKIRFQKDSFNRNNRKFLQEQFQKDLINMDEYSDDLKQINRRMRMEKIILDKLAQFEV